MIYLDNAATSFPKPGVVYDEMDKCMRSYCANPGRGGHSMALIAGQAVAEARDRVSCFFGISQSLRLCFTGNATQAINMGIKGVLKPGDHVITTGMEHNSVIRPLKTMERDTGIELTVVKCNEYGEIDVEDVRRSIKSNTRMIVTTFSSNVNGIIMPVGVLGGLSKEAGVLFMVDASQGAGTVKIDVKEMNIDILAFPGHKGLLGPQGTGGLYVAPNVGIRSIIEGGTGSKSENLYQPQDMPDLLESGTVNTPGIAGLAGGVSFVTATGIESISSHKHMLVERLIDGLCELKNVRIYSRRGIDKNSGIVAFNIEGVDSPEVSYVLDRVYNIATRAGLHCAPLAHKTLGSFDSGLVRISVGYFNTIDDIDSTLRAVREICASL